MTAFLLSTEGFCIYSYVFLISCIIRDLRFVGEMGGFFTNLFVGEIILG